MGYKTGFVRPGHKSSLWIWSIEELHNQGKAYNLTPFCCKFSHKMFKNIVDCSFLISYTFKLKNLRLNVITEKRLCLCMKDILDQLKHIALFCIPTHFIIITQQLHLANIFVGLNFHQLT